MKKINKCDCCIDSKKRYEICRKLRFRYGISLLEKEKMIITQKGKCALCDGKPTKIDHRHKNGKIRGVICDKCNVWLAPLDNSDWLLRAASYLMRGY